MIGVAIKLSYWYISIKKLSIAVAEVFCALVRKSIMLIKL
jgi:hypothetical protein